MNVVFGIHSVYEVLKSRPKGVHYIAMARGKNDIKVQRILEEARVHGIQVKFMEKGHLGKLSGTEAHQGIVAITAAKQYQDVDDLLANKRGEQHFLLVLDGVEDPHNLGALLRTADAAGVDGVIIPERRAAGVTGTVAKSSAGASEHVPVARVTNISRTIEELKEKNIWTVGLDERGDNMYDRIDYNVDCAIILGAEGKGLHDLVRRKCDFLVAIPMLGAVESLNVSVAGGVVMYEAVRQRTRKNNEMKKK